MTEAAGRPAYEISNHARPGRECRHNLIYWRYGDYAGVGPGAHGRLMLGDARVATSAERLPERWQDKVAREGHGYVEQIAIGDDEAAREHLLMNLRLSEGLDLASYEKRWNIALDRKKIAELASDDLVQLDGTTLRATPRGRLVLNSCDRGAGGLTKNPGPETSSVRGSRCGSRRPVRSPSRRGRVPRSRRGETGRCRRRLRSRSDRSAPAA